MSGDQPSDLDPVGSDDSSIASQTSSGKKRAGAPAKYVWQCFKRYKDALGNELDDSLRSMILEELDIALHYDITDKMWDGECVTLEADAAVAPIGNDVDAAAMDLEQMLARQ
ncbi:MAG: hypothetical protein FRX49_00116 [Trebouxia sp. A1-2]|nr:MAG: hypothetical protein FRX49_00116 [Trebouxia sp. A1-2]